MSGFLGQAELDAQAHSKKKLADIRQRVQTAGLLKQLDRVPRFDAYEFVVQDGAVMINFGRVDSGPAAGHVSLYPDARTSLRGCELDVPSWAYIEVVKDEELRKKGVFAWDRDLYEGLFSDPMDRRSAALLQLAFIELEADGNRSVESYPGLLEAGFDVEALLRALELIENKSSARALLEKIRARIPAVDKLPGLPDTQLDFQPHDKSEAEYLPLRLYIGRLAKDSATKVWMYMTRSGGRLHQTCEAVNNSGVVTTFRTGTATDLEGVELIGMLKASRVQAGKNYRQITCLTRYYFFLKYAQDGCVLLREEDMPMNDHFHRYIENGIRAYLSSKTPPPDPSIFTYNRNKRAGENNPQPTPEPPPTERPSRSTRNRNQNYRDSSPPDDNDDATPPDPNIPEPPSSSTQCDPPPTRAGRTSLTLPISTVRSQRTTPITLPPRSHPLTRPPPTPSYPLSSSSLTTTTDLRTQQSTIERALGEALITTLPPRRIAWNEAQETADEAFAQYVAARASAGVGSTSPAEAEVDAEVEAENAAFEAYERARARAGALGAAYNEAVDEVQDSVWELGVLGAELGRRGGG
ncbi:hypothetical protein PMIN06_008673 [Paraphaeosphaeria minitans]|uniref:Uncharacterized protein n=1 Tax=Paraphaeosphaeria minitans TaxID=565426 RepID=A0A9P6KKI9_9PLEO|nr:hypothetical protein PMIN01_12383 [Paraphaeosphaeria minitans]